MGKHAQRAGFLLCLLLNLSGASGAAVRQQVVDRIVARVDEEIILQSDVEQLEKYQLLVDGKSESREQILDRLIDQWIVRKEAEASRFPTATDSDVDRGLQRLQRAFAKKEDFETQRGKAGLTELDLKQIITAQVFLSNYLDSRFRPTVQVDEQAIKDFYDQALIPRAKARGQEPPTFDAARDVIQEVLIQRGINEQADKWLKESRGRLHISKFMNEGGK
jgi:peptidyl-prolyl cis-trans isomerase SurA